MHVHVAKRERRDEILDFARDQARLEWTEGLKPLNFGVYSNCQRSIKMPPRSLANLFPKGILNGGSPPRRSPSC
jgi:hypothetical protein